MNPYLGSRSACSPTRAASATKASATAAHMAQDLYAIELVFLGKE